jgi:hypothetical protein
VQSYDQSVYETVKRLMHTRLDTPTEGGRTLGDDMGLFFMHTVVGPDGVSADVPLCKVLPLRIDPLRMTLTTTAQGGDNMVVTEKNKRKFCTLLARAKLDYGSAARLAAVARRVDCFCA